MCRQSCGSEAATGGDDAGRAGSGSYCLLLSDVRAARGCAVGCLVRPQLSRLRSVCSPGEAECGAGYSDSSAQSADQQQLQWNGPIEVGKLFLHRLFLGLVRSRSDFEITSLKLHIVCAVDTARRSA